MIFIKEKGKGLLVCFGIAAAALLLGQWINPYLDTEYFQERKFKQGMRRLSGRFKLIWKNLDGRCYHCGMPLEVTGDREIYFKIPKSEGGKDEVPNMAYTHKSCQQLYLESRSKE